MGNISNQATAASVRAAFEGFGPVIDAAAFPARIGPLGYAIVVFERVSNHVSAVIIEHKALHFVVSLLCKNVAHGLCNVHSSSRESRVGIAWEEPYQKAACSFLEFKRNCLLQR